MNFFVQILILDVKLQFQTEVDNHRYHKCYKIMQVKTQQLLLRSGDQVNDSMFRPKHAVIHLISTT